jgi:Tol biopolymer transport system component
VLSLPPGVRLGPYAIAAPLGAGGMGEVYRATDTQLGRDVAIKVLPLEVGQDAERLARFEREAKLLASLNHPSIAHVYGFESGKLPGGTTGHFLAMELVEGEDLAERLKRGAIPVDEALPIAKQIAEALEEAHERGIVHRDLKPANVKVTPEGRVKVLDFGLAKAMAGEADASSSPDLSQSPTLARPGTQAGLILGTAAYMSPEQARGKTVDRRADIWAFGAVLFEMLTGRRLFAGETVSDTLAAVLKTDPDWGRLPAGTPPSVERLLHRCLDRDVKQRLQAIGEARIALEGGSSADAASDGAARRASLSRFMPWTAALLMGLAAGWALLSRGATRPAAHPVMRFDIAYPSEIEPLPMLENGFALSPDGQLVAMIGVRNGARALFVRRLESADMTVIIAQNPTGVAFSPDSKSVVIVGTDLVCVSLVDGQRTVIVSNPDLNAGVAWTSAGVVFPRNGGLWVGSPQGGEPRALTTLDTARHEVLHVGPTALPGGRKALFSSLTTDPGTERIEAVSIDGGGRSVIVERATAPALSPTGHLLFARDGALLAAPFDSEAARVLGPATPIVPAGVVGAFQSGNMAFAVASNGTLLFLPRDFATQRVVSVARDGRSSILDLPRGQYANPRVSPDGRELVVVVSNSSLETLNLQRGSRGQLTSAAGGTAFPTWSQDGRRVVSRRFNRPAWVSADGSQQGGLPGALVNDFPSSPGADPDSILVTRIGAETAGDVFLMSLSGKFEPRALVATKAYEGGPQLSPDARWLAYVANQSGMPQVYVRPYPALDRQWQISEGLGFQPRWNTAGREIDYRDGQSLMAVSFDGSRTEPVIAKPTTLFKDEYDMGLGLTTPNYDVTPDGRFILLRRDAQVGNLRIVLNWTEELKQILAKGGPQ